MLLKDSLYIGEGPADEACPQVGDEDYTTEGRRYASRYIMQIRRAYGKEPANGRLWVKSNPHDFGSYYTVEYDYVWETDGSGMTVAEAYGYDVEGDTLKALRRWDRFDKANEAFEPDKEAIYEEVMADYKKANYSTEVR